MRRERRIVSTVWEEPERVITETTYLSGSTVADQNELEGGWLIGRHLRI